MTWPTVQLNNIITDYRNGFACGEESAEGVVQFRMNNVDREGSIDWSKVRRVPENKAKSVFLLQPNDILLNTTNSPDLVGKVALFSNYEESVTFSNHFARIRVNRDIADPAFVARFLRYMWQIGVFRGMCRQWVNQASVSREQVGGLLLSLPPLDHQSRFACILDKFDFIRKMQRKTVFGVSSLKKSIFFEMFGDPSTNPKRWQVSKFGEVGELDRGVSKHRPRNDPSLIGGIYPLIQTGEIANCDGYIRKYTSTYSEIGLKQSRMWKRGTLCITIAANIGKTGILTFDACFPDSVVGFTPGSRVTTEYVQIWLGFVQKMLEDNAPQFAQKNINLGILRQLDIPVPPIELQCEFTSRMLVIESIIQKKSLFNDKIDQLFSAVQQQAFKDGNGSGAVVESKMSLAC